MTPATKEKLIEMFASVSPATEREKKVWRANPVYDAFLRGPEYLVGHIPMFKSSPHCATCSCEGPRLLGLPIEFTEFEEDIALVDRGPRAT